MKKIQSSLCVVGIALAFCSCNQHPDPVATQEIKDVLEEIENLDNVTLDDLSIKTVGDQYSISIPEDLTVTTSLNDAASLQYNNIYSEKYIIVIDEDKQSFIDILKSLDAFGSSKELIDEYADIQISSFGENLTISNQSKVIKTNINGMDARLFAFDATIEGVAEPISYWTGYYVGKDNLYTIMAWTLKSLKNDYEKEANLILKSLKESY